MSYATAKSARRAARKQGLENFEIVEVEGKFDFVAANVANENVDTPEVETPAVETPADEQLSDEQPSDETPEAPVAEDKPIEIVMPTADVSTPFAFIWAFLAANPTVPRKAQIAAMIACGYNANTVKTQVSRYYKVGGDKAAWLAGEKAKRDIEKAKIAAMVAEIQAARAAEAAKVEPTEPTEPTEVEQPAQGE